MKSDQPSAEQTAESPELAAPQAMTGDEQEHAESEEINGPKGPEPTRFGDWERKGRCIDF